MKFRPKKARLNLEHLEDRTVPAFSMSWNPSASTWVLKQTSDQGAVTVSVTNTNSLTITEQFGGATTVGTAGANLQIDMLSDTDDLTVDLDTGLDGWLKVNLANGDRDLNFTGSDNSVGGNLTVTAAAGDQQAFLAINTDLGVGGMASIDLGVGLDSLYLGNPALFTLPRGALIGTDLNLRGVNIFEHTGTLLVGRNVSWINNFETEETLYQVGDLIFFPTVNLGQAIIAGNFTFQGNSEDESFFFDTPTGVDDGAIIGGSVYINLAANYNTIFVQQVRLEDATIGGSLTVVAGLNPFTTDRVIMDEETTIGGNISINLGEGAGGGISSEVNLLGTFGGQGITLIGGTGNDSFGYGMVGNRASVRATMGAGVDTFTLNGAGLTTLPPGTATLSYLDVDFGAGNDVYDNRWGATPYNFTVYFRNL